MSDPAAARAFAVAARTLLGGELAAWRRLGTRPRLWWRDDDARRPDPRLDRLLTVAGGRPLSLAVIPDGDLIALAARLGPEPNVTIGQHGVDHRNRRAVGPPSEYPAPPSFAEFERRIAGGRARLQAAGLSPTFYTPPWNAIDPGLGPAAAAAGYRLLSASADAPAPVDGLAYASAELDILSWKRGGVFKGTGRVLSALGRALSARRRAGDLQRPVGLLTHHLAHDAAAWRFLALAPAWLDRHAVFVGADALVHPEPDPTHRPDPPTRPGPRGYGVCADGLIERPARCEPGGSPPFRADRQTSPI